MSQAITNLIHPFVKDWQYGGDGYYYWDPEYHSEFDASKDSYADDWGWESFIGGFPDYQQDQIDQIDSEHWFEAIYYFRYLFDIVFIALPWFIFSLVAIGFNLYVNIEWNQWWAGGNLWLILNTFNLWIFILHSWALAIEWPAYLEFFRILRWILVWWCFMFLFFYVLDVLLWTDQLYIVQDKENYDFMTIYVNMMLGYDMVIHSPNVPVSLFIIFKEFSMLFFTFISSAAGTDQDKLSMNFWEDEKTLEHDFEAETWENFWDSIF